MLENLHKFGYTNFYGLDVDLESLAGTLDESYILVRRWRCSAFESGRFDYIFCHYLLLWVSNPFAVLQEATRALKPSGHFAAYAEPDYVPR